MLVGDGGTGKSTLVPRHLNGHFNSHYEQTQGVNIRSLNFQTNYGQVKFEVWDIGSMEKYETNLISFYDNADGAIILFSLTSPLTYRSLDAWRNSVLRMVPNIPTVLCGNKVDCPDRKIISANIDKHRQWCCPYYEISAKSNYNFEKPFLSLAGKLLGRDDLIFTSI